MRQGTIGDIADEHGISAQRADQWRNEYPDFPVEIRKGRTGRVYNLDAVRKWAVSHGLGKATK